MEAGSSHLGARNESMPVLPEDCIANIVSFAACDPREACRLSMVSSSFNNDAVLDALWEKFLPPDYHSIVSNSSSSFLLQALPSKKQLFLSLSDNPILIHNGKKSFSLEKWSGKKCYMISARDMHISWGGDTRYWRWNFDSNSRFGESAELLHVCWLDISGKINTCMLSPETLYGAYLVFMLTQNSYGLGEHPINVGMGLADSVHFDPKNIDRDGVAKKRRDGWLEIELGDFFNTDGGDGDVEMRFVQVEHLHWKSGLIVQGIEIRPKAYT